MTMPGDLVRIHGDIHPAVVLHAYKRHGKLRLKVAAGTTSYRRGPAPLYIIRRKKFIKSRFYAAGYVDLSERVTEPLGGSISRQHLERMQTAFKDAPTIRRHVYLERLAPTARRKR